MFKTLSSKKVFTGKIFDITEEQVLGPDGESKYQFINHRGAVMIIPQDQDGHYYLIRQYRHPIKEKKFLNFQQASLNQMKSLISVHKENFKKKSIKLLRKWNILA